MKDNPMAAPTPKANTVKKDAIRIPLAILE